MSVQTNLLNELLDSNLFDKPNDLAKILFESIISNENPEFSSTYLSLSDDFDFVKNYNPNKNIIHIENNLSKNLEKLISLGMKFEFSNESEYIFEIPTESVVFPICCQGKNRSQFMFYFLKFFGSKITNIYNKFFIGYPTSADELVLINKFIDKNKSVNQNKQVESNVVLSGFVPNYKSDSFSNSINKIFGKEYSRVPHIFDKILRNNSEYSSLDIKNIIPYKFTQSKYLIYDENSDDVKKISELYIKFYLNPVNLIKLVKVASNKDINQIIWICMSDKSFENLVHLLTNISSSNDIPIDFSLVKIIYFNSNDIFQGKNIKSNVLNEFVVRLCNSTRVDNKKIEFTTIY